jgi:NAD+ synthase
MSTPAPTTLKIALAQLNPIVGDLAGNEQKLRQARDKAAAEGADLVVFSELFLTGYPPEDLVLKPAFHIAARARLEALAATLGPGPAVLVGTVWPDRGAIYNAVALLDEGQVSAVRAKVDLPNYGVFDEKRVFAAGELPSPISFRGVRLGVPICEDIWKDEVTECLAECGAEILIVPNGSPFDWKKPDVRMNVAVARVTETGLPLAYVNQVGGQDELVFDGASFVLDADRSLACQLPAWEEHIAVTEWTKTAKGWRCAKGPVHRLTEGDAAAYHACVLGLRDYVGKNRFPGVVLGLSGGVDSALVAAMAVDALGPARVHAIMMPYRYTSDRSIADATACAAALGIRLDTVAIEPAVTGFTDALAPLFAGREPDITEENLQSRARGVVVMAISNKFGAMVLTTGNKSEMSVGYATLYGDMAGGYSVLKDAYKTTVFALSRWRNANKPEGGLGPDGPVMPQRIIDKPPSAELRPNQKDEDSLPPYPLLDRILEALVEQEYSVQQTAEATGADEALVADIEKKLLRAEYKRRQAPPGVKLGSRNFGRDRRYPITNAFHTGK